MDIKCYSKEYYLNEKKFSPETWYEKVEKMTAKTFFLELNKEELIAMKSFYSYLIIKKDMPNIEQAKTILNLEKKLQKLLDSKNIKNYFIRLTQRSPKDGIALNKNFNKDILNLENFNEKMIQIFKEQEKSLKCSSAKDGINLLVTSERVFTDLYRYLKIEDEIGEILYLQNIVVREWRENTHSMNEFRCFVFKNQMTAISQYNQYIFLPNLFNDTNLQNKIKYQIYSNWLIVKESLEYYENYIIDFFCDGKECFLIELNPFDNRTGPSLFCWNYHKEILLNPNAKTNQDIVFKVAEEEIKNVKMMVEEFMIPDILNTDAVSYLSVINYYELETGCSIF